MAGITITQSDLFETVDSMRDEGVRMLSELIRIPSVNPDYAGVDRAANLGGERRANDYLAAQYERLGLKVDLWEAVPCRSNVVGVWPGQGGGSIAETNWPH